MSDTWEDEHENVLRMIQRNCEDLSVQYRAIYEEKRKQQAKFRIPSIILGSITSITSFGSGSFPSSAYRAISMTVGGVSLFIAILNTIESYMKIGETMGNSLQSSIAFQKLADQIACELSVQRNNRTNQGMLYMKECFNSYQKIIDTSPPILNIPFLPLLSLKDPNNVDPYSRWKKSSILLGLGSRLVKKPAVSSNLSSVQTQPPPTDASMIAMRGIFDRVRKVREKEKEHPPDIVLRVNDP